MNTISILQKIGLKMLSIGDIGYNFNFPFINVFQECYLKCGKSAVPVITDQLDKIVEETYEMCEEYVKGDLDGLAFEVMNIIQACETMMHVLGCVDRKVCFTSNNLEYCDYEIIDEAKRKTYEENKRRGYYD